MTDCGKHGNFDRMEWGMICCYIDKVTLIVLGVGSNPVWEIVVTSKIIVFFLLFFQSQFLMNPKMIFQTGLSSNLHYKSSISPLTYHNFNKITKQFNKTWDKRAHANQLPRQKSSKKAHDKKIDKFSRRTKRKTRKILSDFPTNFAHFSS